MFSSKQSKKLTYSCFYSLILGLVACIEVDTKVSIVDYNIPPTFKLVGTGVRPYLAIRGPYALGDRMVKEEPLWAITIDESIHDQWLSNLPPIRYGEVPSHFKQIYPKTGQAPKLEEGMYYNVYVQVHSAEGGGICFGVRQGKVIACP